MVCEHLSGLETALVQRGIGVTFRGRSWSKRCREWVYFNAYLDVARIRQTFPLPACVHDCARLDGRERGLYCDVCRDALIGLPRRLAGRPSFPDGRDSLFKPLGRDNEKQETSIAMRRGADA